MKIHWNCVVCSFFKLKMGKSTGWQRHVDRQTRRRRPRIQSVDGTPSRRSLTIFLKHTHKNHHKTYIKKKTDYFFFWLIITKSFRTIYTFFLRVVCTRFSTVMEAPRGFALAFQLWFFVTQQIPSMKKREKHFERKKEKKKKKKMIIIIWKLKPIPRNWTDPQWKNISNDMLSSATCSSEGKPISTRSSMQTGKKTSLQTKNETNFFRGNHK